MTQVLNSLFKFCNALFFILVGVVGMMIPWSNHVRMVLTHLIFEDSLTPFLFGFVFFLIGMAMITAMYLNRKKRHYRIRSSKVVAFVDEAVIQEYLDSYWKHLYPNYEIPCQLNLKGNKIHISVDLPHLPIPEQKPFLERVRKDLTSIFDKVLGYQDEFFLSASFQG